MWEDFHTHNLEAEPGSAIVNLPIEALSCPSSFVLRSGGVYSAGIHPWWTSGDCWTLWKGLVEWLASPQVIAVGECGLDKLRGAELAVQEELFEKQVLLAEEYRLPVTVHCVKAYDRLIALHKKIRPVQQWTVHGFRGKPELAAQLLAEGLNLSFGLRYNRRSWEIVPPSRRYRETDDGR